MNGSDVAAIIVAVIYGFAHIYTAVQSREAKRAAEANASSIGPTQDGESIRSILETLRDFNAYQHERNHDIGEAVHGVTLYLYLIGRKLDVDLPPPPEHPLPPL